MRDLLLPLIYSLTLLSDLKTPALVVDLSAHLKQSKQIPTIRLTDDDGPPRRLVPEDCEEATANEIPLVPSVTFLHTTVIAAKNNPVLATLDANTQHPSHLVLGLNNHHVGSYYWARSAGTGAAMEAPGVVLVDGKHLQWQDARGPTYCNSNDGKRSEWVNFLKVGDTVQLLPDEPSAWIADYPVYGVSATGRPLGSEPAVVCRYRVEESR